MPDLKGLSGAEATAKVKNLKLNLGSVTETETKSATPGTVINQTPAAGTEIEEGGLTTLLAAKVSVTATSNPPPASKTNQPPASKTNPPPAPPAPPEEKVKRSAIQLVIPGDSGKSQALKIVVTDNNGRRVVYEEQHNAGEKVEKTVEGTGQVRVQVFVNDRLLREQTF